MRILRALFPLSFLMVVICLCGCTKQSKERPPTVLIDGWWNADYAKQVCYGASQWYKDNQDEITELGCKKITACEEQMPKVNACAMGDPTPAVRDFEQLVTTGFATDSACKGAKLISWTGPAEERTRELLKPHWTLFIDYIPGSTEQDWSLQFDTEKQHALSYTKGTGGPKQIAHALCMVVNSKGGSVQ